MVLQFFDEFRAICLALFENHKGFDHFSCRFTIHIARSTLVTIKQNLFFAFFYNGVAIPVAALGLLGTTGPLMAAAAMALSDLTVIGNALRLKRALAKQPTSNNKRG